MAHVYLDHENDSDGAATGRFVVSVWRGISAPKRKTFDALPEARAFAIKNMGRTGSVVDSTRVKRPGAA